jgi:hypothetical protein
METVSGIPWKTFRSQKNPDIFHPVELLDILPIKLAKLQYVTHLCKYLKSELQAEIISLKITDDN